MKNLEPFIILGINKKRKIRLRVTLLNIILGFLVLVAFSLSIVLANKLIITKQKQDLQKQKIAAAKEQQVIMNKVQDKVIKKNYTFKITWGNLGKRMIEDGVIDRAKLMDIFAENGELPKDLEKYLSGNENEIILTRENASFWVDVLWGLGLANKNKILEEGPMIENGDASGFASTGGYSLGVLDAMNYYSSYSYLDLSDKQQKIVEEIAQNIYRPCCGNSTIFPDCNHGMAALALIELMASQNKSKDEIYKTVLAFNTYWFPQTYLETAYYFEKNGKNYENVSPKELLSEKFSSAMRDEAVSKAAQGINWPSEGGGSCGA